MIDLNMQKTNIEQLLELVKQNPDLEIVPMVDTDVVGGDEFAWWTASWGSVRIEEIYNDDEKVYIRSSDEEMLIDQAFSTLELVSNLSDEEVVLKSTDQVANYNWNKVIAVKITV